MSRADKKRIEELEFKLSSYHSKDLAMSTLMIEADSRIASIQEIADGYKEEMLEWKRKYVEQLEKNILLAKELEGRADDEKI